MTELDILNEFLLYPLNSVDAIMERFASLPNAVRKKGEDEQQEFVFVPGNRKDAATLVAHADTHKRFSDYAKHEFKDPRANGIIESTTTDCGIGADDRAGCAILWLLKDSGHHLLITDGEECGQKGVKWLIEKFSDIAEIIQNSSFIVQFDKNNATDCKFYDIPVSEEFKEYIRQETDYMDVGKDNRKTDIVALCGNSCCGVNLSVGYYDEHTSKERLNIEEWSNTLKIARKMLSKPLKRFSVMNGIEK